MSAVLEQLRIHQWLKNLLVFVPLVLAHEFQNTQSFVTTLLTFVVFSVVASAMYVMNDLADARHDALHPTKKHRPIASGRLSRTVARAMLVTLVLIAVGICTIALPKDVWVWLAAYVVMNLAYTYWLKSVVLIDVLLLSLFYTLRLLAGAAAADVEASPWLLAFSLFVFTSLAFMKRYTELLDKGDSEEVISGRGYRPSDASMIGVLGPVMGGIAVLVFVLYLNSPSVVELYSNPRILWLLTPLILYWVSYMWMKAHRGEMHDDPVAFIRTDAPSYVVCAFSAAILVWAQLS